MPVRLIERRRVRRVLELYAAGEAFDTILGVTGQSPRQVKRILSAAGIYPTAEFFEAPVFRNEGSNPQTKERR